MKKNELSDNDLLIADIMIKVISIENLLIKKGIITSDELEQEIYDATSKIARDVLTKAQVSGDIDKIIKDIQSDIKAKGKAN